MKLPIAVFVCVAAGGLACAQNSSGQRAPVVTTAPPAPERVETAQVSESAPIPSGIPTNTPAVAPPAAAAPTAGETPMTLTPASGVGAPRTASAQLVPTDSARDKPDTSSDQESIREIRALLAADPMLAPLASRVTIIARSGRVSLRGQVNTAEQRSAIEKAARQAAGVVNVKNELVAME